MKAVFWIFIVWSILLILLVIEGILSFGHGLGDLYYLLLLLLFTIITAITIHKLITTENAATIKNRNLIIVLVTTIISLTILKLTIWRGPELPWNGDFFVK